MRPTLQLLACALGLSSLVACVGMSSPMASTSMALWGALEKDVNRLGNDYKTIDLPDADPELCQEACELDARCKAFTYVHPGVQGPSAKCWLKDTIPMPRKDEGCCVSGVKPNPPAPAPAPSPVKP